MTGPSGPSDLPDLKQPPAIIVGEGGGPPSVSPTVSDDPYGSNDPTQEPLNNQMETVCGTISDAAWTAAALSAFGEPEDNVLPGVLGVIAGAFGLLGDLFSAVDPPEPAYAHPVVFVQRTSTPPSLVEPALQPLRVVIQQAVFAMVTLQGMVALREHLSGAQAAGDTPWALTHLASTRLAKRQFIVDAATNAAALNAAGSALSGTAHDIHVDPSADVRAWIETTGVRPQLADALQRSGLTPEEIDTILHRAVAGPKTVPNSNLGALLVHQSENLYRTAVGLDRLDRGLPL